MTISVPIKDKLIQLTSQLNKGIITEMEALDKSMSFISGHSDEESLSTEQLDMNEKLIELTKEKELLVVRLIQTGNDEKKMALKLFESICYDYF